MSNVLDQWLGDSISAIEMLEREMNEHHEVIQQAMSTIRRHTTAVERLEVHIEVIRGAASQIESAVEDKRFDQQFDDSYAESWDVDRVETPEPAPDRVDEGAGTPVLQLMAAQPGAVTADSVAGPTSTPVAAGSGRSRLPPPPPSAATRR